MRQKDRDQALAAGAILVVKAAETRAVEVEDCDDTAPRGERHNELRARRRVAGNMAGEGVDVGHDDRRTACGGGAADAGAPDDAHAGRLALKRAEHEFPAPDEIE